MKSKILLLHSALLITTVAMAQGPEQERDRPPMDENFVARMFERFDKNKDGKLSKDEMPERMTKMLNHADSNNDQALTKEEFETFHKNRPKHDKRPNSGQQPPMPPSQKPLKEKSSNSTHKAQEILDSFNYQGEKGCTDEQLKDYAAVFYRCDENGDKRHSVDEYVKTSRHMTPEVREKIFAAADNNKDNYVTLGEYLLNRVITDEAKAIINQMDANKDKILDRAELIQKGIDPQFFELLDGNGDGKLTTPEILRIWGKWARYDYENQEERLLIRLGIEVKKEHKPTKDITKLWAYGLTSRRTGEPLIKAGDEHKMDPATVKYGYNLVVDAAGNPVRVSPRPLQGGEQLIKTETYQSDHNTRAFAQVYTIMAPIRDAILYNFENTSKKQWRELTQVLTLNKIKTKKSNERGPRKPLTTDEVYDYVAANPTDGSAVMRYLEEAGLELKILAFEKDYDFTNPQGGNHAKEHHMEVGSGIKFPKAK